MADAAIKAACITVGIPIAITGTPILSRFILLRLFPILDPGAMPVSAICMVVAMRSILRDASKSTTMISSGLVRSTVFLMIC